MSRSYLVNLLVEVHVEAREEWDNFEYSLENSYRWAAFHDDEDANPYVISAEIESWVDLVDGVADHRG